MCHSSVGGSTRIAVSLSAQLAGRGHTVHLFSLSEPFGDRNIRASGVQLHTILNVGTQHREPAALNAIWSPQLSRQFVDEVVRVSEAEKLEVLHFHYAMPFALLAETVKRRLGDGAPLVIGTLHGTDVTDFGAHPDFRQRLATAFQTVDRLTTVSNHHARLAVKAFGLATVPDVIPNFIDTKKFRPSPVPRCSTDGAGGARRWRLAHLSNFREVKNPRTVIEIFLGVRAQLESELWLIGDGPELESVRRLVQTSGRESDVRFFGLLPDVASTLAQTDLLLVASNVESFCLAAVEAMSCRVPVLASRVGGLPEVVEHGRGGFLFPRHDPGAAVREAVAYLSQPDRHSEVKRQARQRAQTFDQDLVVPSYERLYADLMEARVFQQSGWCE